MKIKPAKPRILKEKQFVTKSLPIGIKWAKTHLIVSALEQNDTVLVERRFHSRNRHVLSGMPYYLYPHFFYRNTFTLLFSLNVSKPLMISWSFSDNPSRT